MRREWFSGDVCVRGWEGSGCGPLLPSEVRGEGVGEGERGTVEEDVDV